jgi:uncharacterized protein (AIM24 family)
MLFATSTLSYSFVKLPNLKSTLAAGSGMYLDQYVAAAGPGLIVMHGYGNVFDRTLSAGESIEVEPGGFFYKESSVTIDVVTHKLTTDDKEGSSGGQLTKGLASRGLSGLRAAKALRKEGLQGILSGSVLQQATGVLTGAGITLMKMTGPGRVGIQSMYQHFGSA